MEIEDKFIRAQKRVAALRGYYIHLISFVCLMVILFFIDLMDSPHWWVHWALIGFGIFLLVHTVVVFGRIYDPMWEAHKIKKIIEKE